MFRISRYWNRIVFFILWNVVKLSKKLVWDYTKKNNWLLKKDMILDSVTRDVLCDYR